MHQKQLWFGFGLIQHQLTESYFLRANSVCSTTLETFRSLLRDKNGAITVVTDNTGTLVFGVGRDSDITLPHPRLCGKFMQMVSAELRMTSP